MTEHRVCNRCIMDTTDPAIVFNKDGFCNHCISAEELLKSEPYSLTSKQKKVELEKLVTTIKKNKKNKKYDCIIGLSGGVDSSYVAYLVKEIGLNPLAIHLDNGWNSELAVMNIENVCTKLDIDLYTYVIDWEEFKDLQLAFLKASTPDAEIPTDHAIFSILKKLALKHGIKNMIMGHNLASESILPKAWSQGHQDWRYIRSVQKIFGSHKLKTFPHVTILQDVILKKIYGLKWINILDYVDFDKEKAKEFITKNLNWRDYGGKHHESNYTKFFQAYILPTKFGFDKRKAHLSSLIVSNQITREDALKELEQSPYKEEEIAEDIKYVTTKFNISKSEFDTILKSKTKRFEDYKNYQNAWYIILAKKIRGIIRK